LLDEGEYHCSIRTIYRLLEEHGEVRERHDQLTHPPYQKPELMATAPNQLWIGYHQTARSRKMDVPLPARNPRYIQPLRRGLDGRLSRKRGVGQATKIEESCKKQHIQPGQLTLHADRGTSMRSKPVALLLVDLGVTKTHSRPHVSDDNPYSESQFRTLKYRQGVLDVAYQRHPERFVRSAPKPPALPSEVWINKPVLRT
jgi:putative transposase